MSMKDGLTEEAVMASWWVAAKAVGFDPTRRFGNMDDGFEAEVVVDGRTWRMEAFHQTKDTSRRTGVFFGALLGTGWEAGWSEFWGGEPHAAWEDPRKPEPDCSGNDDMPF